jgi:hypothetical protein
MAITFDWTDGHNLSLGYGMCFGRTSPRVGNLGCRSPHFDRCQRRWRPKHGVDGGVYLQDATCHSEQGGGGSIVDRSEPVGAQTQDILIQDVNKWNGRGSATS